MYIGATDTYIFESNKNFVGFDLRNVPFFETHFSDAEHHGYFHFIFHGAVGLYF